MAKSLVASFGLAGAELFGKDLFCPDESSWFGIGGGTTWDGNGWTVTGSGGVHGKTSFNLLGGYVEFDVDNSGSDSGVNNNFYTISPDHQYKTYDDYCDGQGPDASSPKGIYCMEMDIYEANGHSNLATTWHTWFNHDGGCDQGGCQAKKNIGGKFHVKAEFGTDGYMHTYFDGKELTSYNPSPSQAAIDSVRDTMKSVGVAFQSTQWTGWVPGSQGLGSESNSSGLANSKFSVSNVKVYGSVIFGPKPPKCSASSGSNSKEVSV